MENVGYDSLNAALSFGPVGEHAALFYWTMAIQFAMYLIPAIAAWVLIDRRSPASFRPFAAREREPLLYDKNDYEPAGEDTTGRRVA